MKEKSILRIKAKNIRKTLPINKISQILIQALRQDKNYINAKNVMLFYPLKNEIDLRELFSDDKNFYLPRVNGNELEVCPYVSGDKLMKSKYNILEPLTPAVNPSLLDLVVVPSLMADSFGFRLGYGGGFYDRFLNKYSQFFMTVSLLPQALIVEELPTDEFDVKINKIIYK